MKAVIEALILTSLAACSARTPADVSAVTAAQSAVRDSVQVNGQLRLVLKDAPAMPGVMYALPSITPQAGAILVSSTRYGSLCRFAVSGRADVHGTTIGLHVAFAERLAMCTADIRSLTYDATISDLSPGTPYDVVVVHEENNVADTLRREVVVVR